MNERREAGQEEAGKRGFRTCGIQYVVGICTLYSIMKMLRFSGFRYKERKTNF